MRCLCFTLALLWSLGAGAEDVTLVMANGDRLTGAVVAETEETITIALPYAGEVTVSRAALAPEEEAAEAEPAPPTEAPKPPRVWSSAVTLDASHRSGNTDTTDLAFGIAAKRTREKHTLTLGLSGAYGEADSQINTRRHAFDSKWQYYPVERWYVFGQLNEEGDDGRKLDLRIRLATGGGYDFVKRERWSLSADLGLAHTWEEWAPYTPRERDAARNAIRAAGRLRLQAIALGLGDGTIAPGLSVVRDALGALWDVRDPLRNAEERSEAYLNAQLGVYYHHKVFTSSEISEELILLPSLDDLGAWRMTSKLAFVTPLRDNIDLRLAWESEYDSEAEESGVERWDNKFLTGVRLAF